MRLFVAFDIEKTIRERIADFVAELRDLAPEARWAGTDNFHITLKFIGEKPAHTAEGLKRLLTDIRAEPSTISFRGTGFFPSARAARVFWVGIESDATLARLAALVDDATHNFGVPREERAFTPHLTLARGGDPRSRRGGSGKPQARPSDRPNMRFARVQEKLATMPSPDFGTMTATEFFLYESKLSPKGARYVKLERFALGT